MNTRLLRRVAKRILAEPRQFQMGSYFADRTSWDRYTDGTPPSTIPNCGTAACIAGWVIVESRKVTPGALLDRGYGLVQACNLLDVPLDTGFILFNLTRWPYQFSQGWTELKFEDRAKRAAARIEHFIATKGAE